MITIQPANTRIMLDLTDAIAGMGTTHEWDDIHRIAMRNLLTYTCLCEMVIQMNMKSQNCHIILPQLRKHG